VATACATPGAVAPTSAPSAAAAPSEAAPSASEASPSASAAATGPDCGTDPVTLNAYFETGFDLPFKLSEEFTKQ
jgi:raffinose/stachyose/melibiose transport system substrate-binding protein